ncbi:hypothetical protein J3458_003524 [Metarhizium acridum]|uniref:uncharacterized protein n=1 Tax=Metarhizium acridum TaxID=92637 RepID=UPI001C6B5E4F|nr:hypothetical protein J3458_003524 [Metarhizium acridum]
MHALLRASVGSLLRRDILSKKAPFKVVTLLQRTYTMEARNRLKTAFAQGKQSMGMWQMIPGANISRLLARSGVDWVMVDCEHGNIDDGAMHDAVPAIAALGVTPLVRLPDVQSWMVKRALDAGAHGILVPLLRSADQAREVVQAAKFPPWGKRGFGSPIAPERFNPVPSLTEYLQQANDALLTMVQIETQEALNEVEEIAAVKGIDVLFIGPFDLGMVKKQPSLSHISAPNIYGGRQGVFSQTKYLAVALHTIRHYSIVRISAYS